MPLNVWVLLYNCSCDSTNKIMILKKLILILYYFKTWNRCMDEGFIANIRKCWGFWIVWMCTGFFITDSSSPCDVFKIMVSSAYLRMYIFLLPMEIFSIQCFWLIMVYSLQYWIIQPVSTLQRKLVMLNNRRYKLVQHEGIKNLFFNAKVI